MHRRSSKAQTFFLFSHVSVSLQVDFYNQLGSYYYKDESECNAQMDAHAQRPRHQDNIQAHHQTHRLRKSMGKESARGESRRDLSKAAAASKGAIG